MGILAWLIFGGIAGWLAAVLAGESNKRGCLTHILVGILGAFIGGLLMEFLTNRHFGFRFDLMSFAVAIIGALVFLGLLKFASGKK